MDMCMYSEYFSVWTFYIFLSFVVLDEWSMPGNKLQFIKCISIFFGLEQFDLYLF